ncbi:MAG: YlxR family protein [Ruminococcaceae bacterium]|nr:YlxR family protein [Oscillospiraceae bacterium]
MEKKVPLRKCLGCMTSFPKKDLVRVLKTPENEVIIDLSGKKSGRGAYICKDKTCLKKAIKAKRLQSNLEIEIPEEILLELEKELGKANEQ